MQSPTSSSTVYRASHVTDICYPKSAQLLTVDQARERIRLALSAVEQREKLNLSQALGRVLAETITSPIDIPPHRNAAMDGYAFASDSIIENQAFSLQIVGCSWAGKPFTGVIANNQCIRIFTGAVVPEYADSVIAQEQVEQSDDRILLPSKTLPYENIRAAGSDVHKDDVLICAPKTLSASDLGLLASAGIAKVMVNRRLKIGIISTGDELTALDQSLQPGQIYDSNRYMLSALLDSSNHDITDLGVIKDDAQLLQQTLLASSNKFDVLISSGGASVGVADFVKQTLEKCGQVNFWKLAIKPGKPLAFGKIGQCWFFGLPGNPVAVLVTYTQFVKPALSQLTGAPETLPLQLRARCETPLRKSPGRQEYQRGILCQISPGQYTVRPAGKQDSHQLKVASLANCFIVLDAACSCIEVGTMVTVEPFDISI